MKYIRNIRVLVVMLAGVTMFGCSDWLQVEPENEITKEKFWKSEQDVEAATIAAYSGLRHLNKEMFVWGEIRGDFVRAGRQTDKGGADLHRIMRLEILPSNVVTEWRNAYSVINRANTVLKYAPQVSKYDVSFNEERRNPLMAEAYFIRAMVYFHLVRTFKEVPLILEPFDTDKVEQYRAKDSEEKVLAQIKADVEFAVANIGSNYGSVEMNKGRATRSAAHCLQAEVALWMEDYQTAEDACNKVISRSAYTLLPAINYSRIFTKGNSSEGIFELQFGDYQNQNNNFKDYFLKLDESFLLANNNALGIFPENDIRLPYTAHNGLIIKPYSNGGFTNWMVYRYSDVLMMKAEALIGKEQMLKAQRLINAVRKRAELGPIILPEDVTQSESLLLEERAREFAFEGKRWYDLLRMAKRRNFSNKEMLIDILTANVNAGIRAKMRSLLSDPNSYYLPINRTELQNNTKLKQNPYYVQ